MANGVATFDALAYYNELKSIGMDDRQANLQAEAMRKVCEAQKQALKNFADTIEEKQRNELATRADLRETELRLLADIALVRQEMQTMRSDLGREIEKAKNTMIYWFAGTLITLAGILAKGFHWFGL